MANDEQKAVIDEFLSNLDSAHEAVAPLVGSTQFVLLTRNKNGSWSSAWNGKLLEMLGALGMVAEEVRDALRSENSEGTAGE